MLQEVIERGSKMRFEWVYLELVNGRLVDDRGCEANGKWPSFRTFEDADSWLRSSNIRATVIEERQVTPGLCVVNGQEAMRHFPAEDY